MIIQRGPPYPGGKHHNPALEGEEVSSPDRILKLSCSNNSQVCLHTESTHLPSAYNHSLSCVAHRSGLMFPRLHILSLGTSVS